MIEHGTDNEDFILENQKLDRLIEMYIELEVQEDQLVMYQDR